jgi:hypothetical protein
MRRTPSPRMSDTAKLGEKDDRIEDIEIGKIDVGHQLTMNLERGAAGHLLGPVLQTARDREGQLPEHP